MKAHLRLLNLCNAEGAAPGNSAVRYPTPVPAFRLQPAQTPRGRRGCSRAEYRRVTQDEGAGPRGRAGQPSPTENNPSPRGSEPGSWRLGDCTDSNEQLARKAMPSCVSLGVAMVLVAGSTVKRGGMSPVVQGSVNGTSEKPLCPCRWVWQNCSCLGCSPS